MIRALFVTYGMRASFIGPSMIGALKRCLRLLEHLPEGAIEPHWVHSGPVFEDDPLVREMTPGLTRYDLHGRRLHRRRALPRALARVADHRAVALPRAVLAHGPQYLYMDRGMRRLLRDLRPDVVVLGENPLGGLLRAAARAAREAGVPTVAIDDHLSPWQPAQLVRSSPHVTAWFLVGLPFDDDALDHRMALAPPLLPGAPATPEAAVDVTIFGYDPQVARLGLTLLARLPAGVRCRVIAPSLEIPAAIRRVLEGRGSLPRVVRTPPDSTFRAYLEATRVVFCKSGFQQIVETLAVGTPVVACEAGGGVIEAYLGHALRPFVKFVRPSAPDWDGTLAAVRQWIAARPLLPWTPAIRALPHPARHGAEVFLHLLRRVTAAPGLGATS